MGSERDDMLVELAHPSQLEGQEKRKANKIKLPSQKVSTTLGLVSLVHPLVAGSDSGWRLGRQSELELF
jgi:hypothetical protein